MPMKRQEFVETLKERNACAAVVQTGMPQANAHERRALRAKLGLLSEKIAHAPWQQLEDGTIKER